MIFVPPNHPVNPPKLISRTDAKAAGLTRFFNAVPCRNGHIVERYVRSGECAQCRKEQHRREQDRFPNKNKERCSTYYVAHKQEAKRYATENAGHINELRRERKRQNPEKYLAVRRRWESKNRSKLNKLAIEHYWRARKKIRAYQSSYYANNPIPFKRRAYARRALLKDAIGTHSQADIDGLFEKQKGRCAICFKKLGVKYHVDHIEPLVLGGANDVTNLQLAHPRCNIRKKAKNPFAFALELGRLL